MRKALKYFQANLHGDDRKVMKLLKEKGISHNDALETFQIGYSGKNLEKIVDKENYKELVAQGLISLNNKPYFSNFLLMPLYDIEGKLVNFFGQRIPRLDNSKRINNQPCGVGNPQALRHSRELYVTDTILVALQLYQAGYHNTILVPDSDCAKLVTGKKLTIVRSAHINNFAAWFDGCEIYTATFSSNSKSIKSAIEQRKPYFSSEKPKSSEPILDRVVKDLTDLGYVGEEKNKKLAYLVAISRKLNRPLSSIIVSSSGAGKTGLMRAISELVPPEDKILLSRLTPQALFHMPKDALMEKLIVVDERNGSSMADYSIRTMQTSNVLTLASPKGKDDDSGIKSIAVKSAYMESTTSEDINPENASRCLILHLDESRQATKRILESQRISRGLNSSVNRIEVLDWHHHFQRSLLSLKVQIPYVEYINFPYHDVSCRREQEKFLSLIESVALANQENREIVEDTIIATIADYETAYDLFMSVYKDQHNELSRNSQKFLELLEEENFVQFTMRQALSVTNWSYGKVHRCLQELLQYDYIESNHSKKGRHAKTYSVLDYSEYGAEDWEITTPEELSNTCPRNIQQLSKNYQTDKAPSEQGKPSTIQNSEREHVV